jgi:hypothetical protein
LAAAIACEPGDAGRARSEDVCEGEFERGEHELLDDARSPPMGALGPDAIRFSSAPSLGGDALVIQIVPKGRSPATVKAVGLRGHPRYGWSIEDRLSFSLSPSAYRRLAARVDAELAKPVITEFVDGQGEEVMMVCMDGPGFVTERATGGRTFNLEGSCGESHPNDVIAQLMFGLLCPRLGVDFPALPVLRRSCRLPGRRF